MGYFATFFKTEMSNAEQIDIDQNFQEITSTLFRYEDTTKKKNLVSNQYFHTQIEFRNKAKISKFTMMK